MSKLTLIQLVQKIHNTCDFDEVNSINDTPESLQVAEIVEDTYFDIITRKDWPHLKEVTQLSSSGDNLKPTHMQLNENIREVKSVFYNTRKASDTKDKVKEMVYMLPDDFLRMVNQRDSADSSITVVTDFSGISINVRNDNPPQYYTSFDDEWVVLDSYDTAVDTTLQAAKSQLVGIRQPVFTQSDGFVPDLPVDGFPALLAEAKSAASLQLRQVADEKSEQQARRQYLRMARKNWTVSPQERYPNYGRRKNPRAWGR